MTMEYISRLPIQGIKLQLLHILKGTDLGTLYEEGRFTQVLSLEDYVDLVISCLELLPGGNRHPPDYRRRPEEASPGSSVER